MIGRDSLNKIYFIECPATLEQPLQNGIIIGNMNNIGSKRRLVCNQGFLSQTDVSTCSNGTWSDLEDCIRSKDLFALFLHSHYITYII